MIINQKSQNKEMREAVLLARKIAKATTHLETMGYKLTDYSIGEVNGRLQVREVELENSQSLWGKAWFEV